MKKPKYLQRGDKVVLLATARKVSPKEMEPAIRLLHSWGLEVSVPEHLYDQEGQFAGSDETRTLALQSALNDDAIKAIFCARGGYGTVRIIDKLDFSKFIQNPKWIIGYSDITVLHSHIQQNFGIETLHATMPIDVPSGGWDVPSVISLKEALWGHLQPVKVLPHPLNRFGDADGIVVGGNLSILYSLCGSVSDIDTTGKILFIEDLDEYLYHIDRMMQNLKRTDKLSRIKGLMVGALTDMHDNSVAFGKIAEEIIFDAVQEFDYPVCFNMPFGHIKTQNCALPLGCSTLVQVKHEGVQITWK